MLWDESHVCLEIDIREGKPGLVLGGAARGADAREGRRLGRPAGQKRRPVRKERRGVVRVGEEVEGEAFQKGWHDREACLGSQLSDNRHVWRDGKLLSEQNFLQVVNRKWGSSSYLRFSLRCSEKIWPKHWNLIDIQHRCLFGLIKRVAFYGRPANCYGFKLPRSHNKSFWFLATIFSATFSCKYFCGDLSSVNDILKWCPVY